MRFKLICFRFQEAFTSKVHILGLVVVAKSLKNLILGVKTISILLYEFL